MTPKTALLAQRRKAGGARPDLERASGPRGLDAFEANAKRTDESEASEGEKTWHATPRTSGENEEAFCASTRVKAFSPDFSQSQRLLKQGCEEIGLALGAG